MVIDLFGLSIDDVQSRFPEVYQWILNRVKPEREAKAVVDAGLDAIREAMVALREAKKRIPPRLTD